MVNDLYAMILEIDPDLELKHNKFYIGLAKQGEPNNFVIFRPKKDWVRLEMRIKPSDEIQRDLENQGLDLMDFDEPWNRYRVRLAPDELKKHAEFLRGLPRRVHAESL